MEELTKCEKGWGDVREEKFPEGSDRIYLDIRARDVERLLGDRRRNIEHRCWVDVETFWLANWGQVKRSWDYNVRGARSLSARVPERAPEDAQRTWRGPANLRGALLRGFMQASGNWGGEDLQALAESNSWRA